MEKNDLYVLYGDEPVHMAFQLAEEADLAGLIGARKKRVGLKPNLVLSAPASQGATTHPEILEGLILYLQERGFSDLVILEGSWVGARTERAFQDCGYAELSRRYGVELIDTQKDTYKEYDCKGMKLNICDSAMSVDFMINLPVLKGHCQTMMTCSLKNSKGLIPNTEKRRFHTWGLHKPIAHLNTVVRSDFIVVDGLCGDLDFEEGGNPVPMNRMLAARDRVLCDAYACELMGHELRDVPYIALAEALGVGCADTAQARVHVLNTPLADPPARTPGGKVSALGRHAAPKDACSACYGSLIHALARMSESGSLPGTHSPICIGQGYKVERAALGVGSCTRSCEKSLPGCPPKADNILRFLEENL